MSQGHANATVLDLLYVIFSSPLRVNVNVTGVDVNTFLNHFLNVSAKVFSLLGCCPKFSLCLSVKIHYFHVCTCARFSVLPSDVLVNEIRIYGLWVDKAIDTITIF